MVHEVDYPEESIMSRSDMRGFTIFSTWGIRFGAEVVYFVQAKINLGWQ